MLVGARHDKSGETLRRELVAQQLQPRRPRQPGEIPGAHPVMVRGGQRRLARFERPGQFGRGRLGDEGMPARADLGRRREDAGDQHIDRVGIE
jgi:hypothetical protein